MTKDEALDLFADCGAVLLAAYPLGFVAVVWSKTGFDGAMVVLAPVVAAYMFGRWQAGKRFARDLGELREHFDAKRRGEDR